MKRDNGFKIPFAVVRQIGTSMEDQLVSGFARVIRSGMYADGMPLPGVRKLAILFGVSEITIRNAVKRLCREGLLAARPRVGLTVCAPGRRSWRGSVLGIKAGPPGMYFSGVLENSMSSVLRRNGWLYTSVEVSSRLKAEDMAMMEMLLDPSVKLIVLFEAPPPLSAHVAKMGISFVEVRSHSPSKVSVFTVGDDLSGALSELARTLRASGVRTVLSVYQHSAAKGLFSEQLARAGLKVRALPIHPIGGRNVQEFIQRAGMQTFAKMLENGSVKEDAVVCNDDYLAAGILSAIDWKGVRMPRDIRFATMSNKGLGPVHPQDLTRVEYDPVLSGVRVGESILAYLETGKATPCSIAITFKRGETV